MKLINVLLLGVSLDSDNEGVNALCYGALEVIVNNYTNSSITILEVNSQKKDSFKIVKTNNDIEIKIRIVYVSGKELLKYLALSTIGILSPKTRLGNIFSNADVVFSVNEGDSFSDIYGFKRLFRHFTDSKIALNYHRKVIFLPQTIGPFNSIIGKTLASNILRNIDSIYVRDTKAFDFLSKLKVRKTLSIDMAVYMPPSRVDFPVKENTIGININGLMYFGNYQSHKGLYDNYQVFLCKLIDLIIRRGYNVLLVPHTYQLEEPSKEDDLLAIKDFITKFSFENKVSYIDNKFSAKELKYIISKLDFFLGSRMHACIGSLSSSVPAIGLAYSYKFEGTFKMFNSDHYVHNLVSLNNDDIEKLLAEISEAINERDKYRERLIELNSQRTVLKL